MFYARETSVTLKQIKQKQNICALLGLVPFWLFYLCNYHRYFLWLPSRPVIPTMSSYQLISVPKVSHRGSRLPHLRSASGKYWDKYLLRPKRSCDRVEPTVGKLWKLKKTFPDFRIVKPHLDQNYNPESRPPPPPPLPLTLKSRIPSFKYAKSRIPKKLIGGPHKLGFEVIVWIVYPASRGPSISLDFLPDLFRKIEGPLLAGYGSLSCPKKCSYEGDNPNDWDDSNRLRLVGWSPVAKYSRRSPRPRKPPTILFHISSRNALRFL